MAGGWLHFFENGPITKQFIWDKGVNQLVTMASFDHFAQILLIQIVLIAVFFGVAFYVFQKSDMAKRNNFMYFPWMEDADDLRAKVYHQNLAGAFNQALMELGATICVPNGAPLLYRMSMEGFFVRQKNRN